MLSVLHQLSKHWHCFGRSTLTARIAPLARFQILPAPFDAEDCGRRLQINRRSAAACLIEGFSLSSKN
uniref:Uncharacterized protein n=1 Tax=Arundo donax TaxID=35708 RepID=A0A0A9EN46_ARUDO